MAALRDCPTDDKVVQAEFAEVKQTVGMAKQFGFKDLFVMGKQRVFHRVALGYFNQVFQQICGIYLVILSMRMGFWFNV